LSGVREAIRLIGYLKLEQPDTFRQEARASSPMLKRKSSQVCCSRFLTLFHRTYVICVPTPICKDARDSLLPGFSINLFAKNVSMEEI
jgi:hypothetical protein